MDPTKSEGRVRIHDGIHRRAGLLWCLWAAFLPALGDAQAPELRFEHVSIDQGLSQNTIYAIAQDRTGFLWLGTGDGLNRYDGYRFEVFRSSPLDANSLSHNQVRAILEDRDGILWIGTRNGGLNRYDRQTRTFTRYQHDPADPQSLAHDLVWTIFEDRVGTLWVGTGGGGLDRFEAATGSFTHLRHDPADPTSLSQDFVECIEEDQAGRLWVGTRGGLNRLDPTTRSFVRYRVDPEAGDRVAYNVVSAIQEDRSGHFWLGTRRGLVRFDPDSSLSFTYYRHDPSRPNGPGIDSIWDIDETRDGRLWLSTFGGGLLLFDPDLGSFLRYRHDPDRPASLSRDKTTTLHADRSGTFWIGTEGGGLNKLGRTGKAFTHYGGGSSVRGGLNEKAVMALHEDRSGILWVGTWGGGLNRLDRSTGAVTHYRAERTDPTRLARDDVRAVLEDRAGTLWVGTEGGGLHRLDRATGTFTRYRHDPRDPGTLRDNDAWVLYEDRAGTLWVGTYGGGLSRYLPETDAFAHHLHDEEDPNTLSSNIVRAIYEDDEGLLWVGTGGGGLNRFDRGPWGSGRFTRFRHDVLDDTSISSDEVLCILESRGGTLWVGTHGGGLNQLVPGVGGTAPSFRFFTEEDGLPSDVVYGILEDRQGRLWMSTNRGLSRFDPSSETFRNYDVTDGLQSNEFNGGAYLKNHRGEMFFGGINGVNAFIPEEIEDNPHVPPVVLTSFRVFNEEVPLATDLASLSTVTLGHRQSVFSFEFAALSYTAPQKNRYAYRLRGFRDQWTQLGTKRDVTFTNLNPGDYTLQVRGSNNDGVWNEAGLTLKVIIEPPVWRTWWFRALALLAGVAVLWGGHQVRIRSMRKHNLALEGEIAERQRAEAERESLIVELEANNEELEARNAEMERFAYTVSHDLKTPLVTIKGFLGMLRRDLEAGNAERMAADMWRIDNAADRMQHLLEDLLELSRVGRLMNPPEEVSLKRLVEEALENASAQLAERRVAVTVSEAMPVVHGDRTRLLEVFQNLIDNAVKFFGDQEAPRIELGARAKGREEVLCWVSDNGLGIDPRYQEKVFGLFERLDQQVAGTGVGLALVSRIVEVHGGRIWVESEGVGRGSTFFFTLPGNAVARGPAGQIDRGRGESALSRRVRPSKPPIQG